MVGIIFRKICNILYKVVENFLSYLKKLFSLKWLLYYRVLIIDIVGNYGII